MYKNTDHFLHALDQESRKRLNAYEASALRTEVEGHLDAEIQARMEMGEAHESAMRQAIATLGSAKSIAAGVSQVHDVSAAANERRTVRAAWAFAALLSAYLLVMPFVSGTNMGAFLQLYLYIGLGLLTSVGIFSFLSRKALPLRLMVVALAAGAGVWISLSTVWLDVAREGGLGAMGRVHTVGYLQRSEDDLRENTRNRQLYSRQVAALIAEGRDPRDMQRRIRELHSSAVRIEQHRRATLDAMARSVPERMAATVGDGATTTAWAWIGMMAFNLGGTGLGHLWRGRRRTREEARV